MGHAILPERNDFRNFMLLQRLAIYCRRGLIVLPYMGAVVSAVLLGYAPGAVAQEGCLSCGEGPVDSFREVDLLLSRGLIAEDSRVLFIWKEATRRKGGPVITGFRIRGAAGGGSFDLYLDENGEVLDSIELAALRVSPKDWSVPLVEAGAAPVGGKRGASKSTVPLTPGLGVPVKRIEFPPLDMTQVRLEDGRAARSGSRKTQRIGVFRELPALAEVSSGEAGTTAGAWQPLADGGRLWSLSLHSPGAVGQRVHFRDLALPEGAEVVVFNAQDPREAYGPYGPDFGEEGEAGETGATGGRWSATCFSDTVVVECRIPPSTVGELRIAIDRIAHIYADFTSFSTKAAGACNLDVTCSPEWANEALAVGGIGIIGRDGVLWCTGSLLADSDPATDVPYFLTAYHCIGSQSGSHGASDAEIYWLYQTAVCDGTPPNPAMVPRTVGGADFLCGSPTHSGSDFALLRLRDMPPDGLAALGWTTLAPQVGDDVTAIHHPRGDFKRITFGHVAGWDRFEHEVHWDEGTTEGGSSGSPLLTGADGLVLGQLRGGGASCTYLDAPDFYGRFDVSFPIAQAWLAPAHEAWDIDLSGTVDAADLQLAVNAALGDVIAFSADVDDSGAVDAMDVQLVLAALLNGTPDVK